MEYQRFFESTKPHTSKGSFKAAIASMAQEIRTWFEDNPQSLIFLWQKSKKTQTHMEIRDFTPSALRQMLIDQWEDPSWLFAVIFPDDRDWIAADYAVKDLRVLIQARGLDYYKIERQDAAAIATFTRYNWLLGEKGREMGRYFKAHSIESYYRFGGTGFEGPILKAQKSYRHE